jgi:thymidylate kinase
MTWILLEGLDRSGKTSVANHYKKLGYQIVHMSAPDKKYFKPGYNGESYLEEMVELYSSLEGKKVLFDRTTYGELIWPNVYGRNPMLSEEDIDYLSGIERNNGAERILMYDANVEMHWKRCVDNNEPLTRQQFGRANIFYDRLVKDYGFIKKQLSDFPGLGDTADISGRSSIGNVHQDLSSVREDDANSSVAGSSNRGSSVGGQNKLSNDKATVSTIESVEDRLEKANAIRTLLQGPVLKKKGGAFDNLEQNVRDFLQTQLDELFEGPKKTNDFSDEETAILKLYVARIKEGMKK